MKKEYSEPILEVQKFSFEELLEGATTPSGTPVEETVQVETTPEVDPGESDDW